MLAALVLAAAVTPAVVADPRFGPSPWALATAGAAVREDATTVMVQLPARGEDIDQRWLEAVVALAAGGRRVIALGGFVPPVTVLPYLDGVAMDPAPPDGDLAALAGAMAGVPLFVTAADAAGAVRVLAAGASGALLPMPSPLWDAEMIALLPEPVAARGPGGELATALRGRDLALIVGVGRDFAGGDVFLPVSPVAGVEWVGERREALAVRRVRDGVMVRVPAGAAVIVARRATTAGDVVAALDVAGESLPTAA
ncbi:MAG: hypothetical protein GW878_00915, partial [Acidobacteria bacterium]|nr:hypothetical protein [Acidobacteriota bacterium]